MEAHSGLTVPLADGGPHARLAMDALRLRLHFAPKVQPVLVRVVAEKRFRKPVGAMGGQGPAQLKGQDRPGTVNL